MELALRRHWCALFFIFYFAGIGASAPSGAQSMVRTLVVDEVQSVFQWDLVAEHVGAGGAPVTPLSPITSVPPGKTFHLRGTVELEIAGFVRPGTVRRGFLMRFSGGDALAVPDIVAQWRPTPFLPPQATVTVTDLHMGFFSGVVPLALDGSYAGDVFLRTLDGAPTDPACGDDAEDQTCQTCMSWVLSPLVGGLTDENCMDQRESSHVPTTGSVTRAGNVLDLVLEVGQANPLEYDFDQIINPDDPPAEQQRIRGELRISGVMHASTALPFPLIGLPSAPAPRTPSGKAAPAPGPRPDPPAPPWPGRRHDDRIGAPPR